MRAQTATEYLILLAVVIIIALIVVGVLGGIPGIGGGSQEATMRAQLALATIGITDYAVTTERTILHVTNNMQQRIRVDEIIIGEVTCTLSSFILNSGQSRMVECTEVTGNTQSRFEQKITIKWTDLQTSASYTLEPGLLIATVGTGGTALASWCLQTNAVDTTACGNPSAGQYTCSGSWDGLFNCAMAYDNNYNSGGYAVDLSAANLEIEYRKPVGATSASRWQLRIGSLPTANVTIPSDCWNQDPLRFRLRSSRLIAPEQSFGQCHDGVGWVTLANSDLGVSAATVFEESIWWRFE